MKQKVSEYVADFLVKNNISDVFTITGGGAMHLNDALGHHSGLKCTYNHHEQVCAIAAEAYARHTNKIAAVCVTSGPGGTNALTGVLGGWLDSIPMFILSGQVKRQTTIWSTDVPLRQLGDQEFNISDCVKTMTKYSVMVTDENKIAYHLEKAMYIANNGRKGPVWIDIPLDVQSAIIDTDNLVHFNKRDYLEEVVPQVSDNQIVDMVNKIKEANRPVILAGTGVRLSGAYNEFRDVIDKLNIPVVTAWNAHDVLEDDHKLYCGRPGTIGTRGGNFVVENSDLLISMGCRMNIRQISYNYKNYAKNSYKIAIDIDKAELQKPTLSIDMPIHADLKDVLNKILDMNVSNNNEEHVKWLDFCKKLNAKYPICTDDKYKNESPVNPYAFINELSDCIDKDDSIICGNGSACVVTFQALKIKKGQRLFTNSGCASMGYGFPAALGVAVSCPDKRVICIDGDGSFQMNLQDMQTMVHNKLNIKIMYLNNSGYHSIRQTQKNLFSHHCMVGVSEENGISFPQCRNIAQCYNVPYYRIDNIKNAKDVLNEMFKDDGFGICEVVLDSNQFFEPKLSSKVLEDGTIVSPPIDDMFPFLDREEYKSNKIFN